MLTSKDIRDIAAYLGANCSYIDTYAKHNPQQDTVNGLFLDSLLDLLGMERCPGLQGDGNVGRVVDLKLRLRELKSLVWEEWVILWRLLHGYDEDYVPEPYQTLAYFLDDYYEGRGQICLKDMASAVVYLQSIGVYVPGTIREELVELTM